MKGLKRHDQVTFLALFKEMNTQDGIDVPSPAQQTGSPSTHALAEQSRVKKLEKLINKRI